MLSHELCGSRFVSHFLHGDHVFEHHFRLVVLSTEPPDAWYDPQSSRDLDQFIL